MPTIRSGPNLFSDRYVLLQDPKHGHRQDYHTPGMWESFERHHWTQAKKQLGLLYRSLALRMKRRCMRPQNRLKRQTWVLGSLIEEKMADE